MTIMVLHLMNSIFLTKDLELTKSLSRKCIHGLTCFEYSSETLSASLARRRESGFNETDLKTSTGKELLS